MLSLSSVLREVLVEILVVVEIAEHESRVVWNDAGLALHLIHVL